MDLNNDGSGTIIELSRNNLFPYAILLQSPQGIP